MTGYSEEEILNTRTVAEDRIQKICGPATIISSFNKETEEHNNLWCLGTALRELSRADAIYFCSGWENSFGCCIEYECAIKYNIMTIFE